MPIAVGIDLGTTFSAIAAVMPNGKPEIIKNSENESLTPSVICFTDNEILIGKEAKQNQTMGDENAVSFFKRVMGNPNWIFPYADNFYTPVDLSAMLLKKLKTDAESALREKISHAVITVPAYFDDLQRKNTMAAGQKAGLEVLRIINEPTAAAVAYGIKSTDEGVYLVYDLGGGTFDVSLVKIDADKIEVIATAGNHELGGKDWDDAIIRYAAAEFQAEFGIDPLTDLFSYNDLLVKAELAKKALSARLNTSFSIAAAGKTGTYTLSREKFNSITASLLELTTNLVEAVLADARYNWNSISGTLLVGGSTRMPMVHDFVRAKSGMAPMTGINVDEAVALGAAIQADMELQERAALALPDGNSFALPPAKAIKDVTSHSLGMIAINEKRTGYINSKIIKRNHPVPFHEVKTFQFNTRSSGRNELEVFITQGESDLPGECTILGKYRFLNVPHNPKNPKTHVAITYAYDKNAVVLVSAIEQAANTTLEYVIEPPGDLSWLNEPPDKNKSAGSLSILMAIDLSGSMSGNPLIKAQEAALGFVKQINLDNSSFGLIAFADDVHTVISGSSVYKDIEKAVNSLSIGQVGIGNGTEPFSQTYKLLKNAEGTRVLILLTDGVWYDQSGAIDMAKKCRDNGIEIIAIGFGSADLKFLEKVAGKKDTAILTDLSNLAGSFDRVAQVLSDRGSGLQLSDDSPSLKNKIGNFFR